MAATQCTHDQDNMLKYKLSIRLGQKCDLGVEVSRADLSISESAGLLRFSHKAISRVFFWSGKEK